MQSECQHTLVTAAAVGDGHDPVPVGLDTEQVEAAATSERVVALFATENVVASAAFESVVSRAVAEEVRIVAAAHPFDVREGVGEGFAVPRARRRALLQIDLETDDVDP